MAGKHFPGAYYVLEAGERQRRRQIVCPRRGRGSTGAQDTRKRRTARGRERDSRDSRNTRR